MRISGSRAKAEKDIATRLNVMSKVRNVLVKFYSGGHYLGLLNIASFGVMS